MNHIEEYGMAIIFGLMTVITFVNVVLREVYLSGISWGLEATSFLFAWLVLLGMSYAIKVNAHLGVDAVLNLAQRPLRHKLNILAAVICVIYAALLFKGAWDYWANFANLPQTNGRFFPTGFEEMRRFSYQAWYEVSEIPIPEFLRFLEPWLNEGESYEKLPRFIPYAMLPLGAGLLLFRCVEALVMIIKGTREMMIVSHEAEEAVAELQNAANSQEGAKS